MIRSVIPGTVAPVLLLLASAGFAAEPAKSKSEPARAKPEHAQMPTPMQKANLERMFKRLDADRDGRLSQSEFRKLAELGQGRLKDKTKFLDRLFEKLDTDNDGYLTIEEFSALRDLRRVDGPKPKRRPVDTSAPADTAAPAAPK